MTVMVMVNSAVDGERYEARVVRTVHESNQKCVSIPKYKAFIVRVYPRLSNSR